MQRFFAILCAIIVWQGCNESGQSGGDKLDAGKAQLDSLTHVAFDLQYNNPAACDSLATVVYRLSEKSGYKHGIAESWFLHSSVQQQLSNYDSAIALANTSLEIFTEINDKPGIARCYNDLGIDYDFKAYYDKAIDYYLKALKLFEELNDTRGQTNAYNNIGLIHQNQSNYHEATINYQKAYDIAVKYSHEEARLNALSNMGSNYIDLGNYDSALRCFTVLLEEDIKSGNKAYISYSYNNVGEAYLGLGEYDNALLYLEKSKVLKEELGNRRALANTLKNLGELHLKTREYDIAGKYLEEARQIAFDLDVPEIRKEALSLLHFLQIQKGDYKAALDYFKREGLIKDEISYDKKNAEISRLEKEFEVEKAQNQLEQSKQKSQANRLLALVYGIIIILLLVLLGGVWLVLRQKQKSNRILIKYQLQLEDTNRMLEEKNTEISRQKKEVELALAARSRFLSFMSHEIRTPLNGITGLVDLLQSQPMTDEQKEFIEALKQSSDNLMLLLNNVLDLSRLETGKIDLEDIAVDLRKLTNDQLALYKASALLRNVELDIQVTDEVPEKLLGDPYRLAQIISNLTNNAIKFTRKGKILVRCSLVDRDEETATILIEIIDTGIGIPKDQLETIMQPFAQAEAHTTRKYGGTGLGLTIVNRLLEIMGSKLAVQSNAGEGSRFYFELKLPIYRAPLIQNMPVPANAANAGLDSIKILVVEDNTTNILLFTRLLASWRTEYDVADSALKAFEFVEQKKYDIILMDLHLPKVTGYEAAEKIKKGESLNRLTPILAITAADESEVKNHPLRGYLDKVIYKPIQYAALLQHIKTLLVK